MASDIYRGPKAPQDKDVLWVKDGTIRVYTNKGWTEIGGNIGNLEEYLSETSTNPIQNSAVFRQYMTFDDIIDVLVSADPDFLNKSYLTFKIVGSGNIIWNATDAIQYSKNGGSWETLSTGDSIEVVEKDQISFKGNITMTYNSNTAKSGFEDSTAQFIAFGNALSLANDSAFSEITTISNLYQLYALFKKTNITDAKNLILSANTLSTMCYANMFDQCSLLKFAPKLPATTLAEGCYFLMFQSCVLLEKTPDLPATTLEKSCYYQMFRSCFALTEVSELPAETATENCYYEMFAFCKSLTVAPELPATTLAKNCYFGMFDGCNKLKESPMLPAEVLAQGCYDGMFYNCSSLNKIVCYATDISATNCTANWVFGVASEGTFVCKHAPWTVGVSGIPEGWTKEEHRDYTEEYTTLEYPTGGTFQYIKNQSPTAVTLNYKLNDGNWTAISATSAVIQIPAGGILMLKGETQRYSTGQFAYQVVHANADGHDILLYGNIMSLLYGDNFQDYTTVPNSSYILNKFFSSCDIKDASNLVFPATNTGTTNNSHAYEDMFSGCEYLEYAPKILPAVDLSYSCYSEMFLGCSRLKTAPELPATTLSGSCYAGMFSYCTALEKAPDLPASYAPTEAYRSMFAGCSALKEIKCMLLTKSSGALSNWVNGVAANGTLTISAENTFDDWGVPSSWTITRI